MTKRILASAVLALVLSLSASAQASAPTFDYVATTVDANGFESSFSTQVVVTFQQGKHIAVLSWTAATVPAGGAAIAGYNIYRGTTSGGPYTKINASLVTSVNYSDTFVLPNAPSSLTGTQQ
jgi:hypothetical protein